MTSLRHRSRLSISRIRKVSSSSSTQVPPSEFDLPPIGCPQKSPAFTGLLTAQQLRGDLWPPQAWWLRLLPSCPLLSSPAYATYSLLSVPRQAHTELFPSKYVQERRLSLTTDNVAGLSIYISFYQIQKTNQL